MCNAVLLSTSLYYAVITVHFQNFPISLNRNSVLVNAVFLTSFSTQLLVTIIVFVSEFFLFKKHFFKPLHGLLFRLAARKDFYCFWILLHLLDVLVQSLIKGRQGVRMIMGNLL